MTNEQSFEIFAIKPPVVTFSADIINGGSRKTFKQNKDVDNVQTFKRDAVISKLKIYIIVETLFISLVFGVV